MYSDSLPLSRKEGHMTQAVQPVPAGAHTVTPHLIVKGVQAALEFYQKAFGAEVVMAMPGPGGRIMHAEIKIGDSLVYMCEESTEWSCFSPLTLQGTPVSIH